MRTDVLQEMVVRQEGVPENLDFPASVGVPRACDYGQDLEHDVCIVSRTALQTL